MADYKVENHGSILLVRPLNDGAREHLQEHVQEDAQWFAGALVVEHRFVEHLVEGLQNEGFEVEL